MALVSVTRLRLRSPFYLPLFFWYVVLSDRQSKQATGNLATQLRNQAGYVFWTLTVWESEAAMRNYVITGSHRQVMPKLATWCDEAAVVHWSQDGETLPSWADAEQRMAKQGRLSPVKYPSADHAAGVIKL